ncbi:MAG: mechanosensitive ion channel family protein [Clostridia bacterium]|nr:mechanosensitive ion channel family protein [Clostridia bacterium]
MKNIIDFISHLFENKLFQSVFIALIAVILSKVFKSFIKRTIKRKKDMTNRLETLFRVSGKLVSFFIYFFAALQISEIMFNVHPTSLLAATGIAGVALGFGAQSLVKDAIAGFFILSENQFAVGELVTIEGFTGTIHEITIRTTVVKNISGDLFTIPNGSISKVINHSRCTRGVTVEVRIVYESDINAALRAMEQVAKEAKDEISTLSAVPEVLGVSSLGDNGIALKMFARCAAGEQFAIERELLKRIKIAFDRENIRMPYVLPSSRK